MRDDFSNKLSVTSYQPQTDMKWHHWVVIGLAVWLIISPWVLGYYQFNLVAWNSIVTGGLIVVFALWNYSPPEE